MLTIPSSVEDQLAAARLQIERCQSALEESEARFRSIIERNADAIVVVGEDGVIRYANAMAGRAFGIEASELKGRPFGYPLLEGETTELDVVVDGTTRHTEMRVTESMWDGDRVLLAMLRDITDLDALRWERAGQLAARLAEATLREIISQAPVAIAVLRGPEHRYDITNALYDELIAHRPVVGKTIREALPELEGQGIYELMDEVFLTGKPFIGNELRLMIERRPGALEEVFFTFVYQPLRESDGTVSAVAIVASDVTAQARARKEVERTNFQLQEQAQELGRARAEAEEANTAKSQFLATMSHELRTPLNAIGGYADLILEEIRGPVTDAQRTDLERIKRSQRHLLSVINDILNFAKLEAGRVILKPVDVSMNSVLGELESLITPTLLRKQIKYEYRSCDPTYKAHVDPERLQQILLNLLSNAAKFTPEGGQISVECGATKTTMRVRVSDTGVGIPEEDLESIFEPFIQLERGQAQELAGTGLGLSISRDLARLMGGDLVAERNPQQGSTFVLTLPRAGQAD